MKAYAVDPNTDECMRLVEFDPTVSRVSTAHGE